MCSQVSLARARGQTLANRTFENYCQFTRFSSRAEQYNNWIIIIPIMCLAAQLWQPWSTILPAIYLKNTLEYDRMIGLLNLVYSMRDFQQLGSRFHQDFYNSLALQISQHQQHILHTVMTGLLHKRRHVIYTVQYPAISHRRARMNWV